MGNLIIFILSFLISFASAATEPEISIAWCLKEGGQPEYRFEDNTRADCLTDTHAIEFDWASNWAEAVGQSLKYASNSGRRAGIILILKSQKDMRYFDRLNLLVNHYGLPIDVWLIKEKEDEENKSLDNH